MILMCMLSLDGFFAVVVLPLTPVSWYTTMVSSIMLDSHMSKCIWFFIAEHMRFEVLIAVNQGRWKKMSGKRANLPTWKCWTNGVICGMFQNVRELGWFTNMKMLDKWGRLWDVSKRPVNRRIYQHLLVSVGVSLMMVSNQSCCKRSNMVWNFVRGSNINVGVTRWNGERFWQVVKIDLWKHWQIWGKNRDNWKRPTDRLIYQCANVGKFGSFVGQGEFVR